MSSYLCSTTVAYLRLSSNDVVKFFDVLKKVKGSKSLNALDPATQKG